MSKENSGYPSHLIEINGVTRLDDGGTSETPIAVIGDGDPEKVKEVAEAIYGVEFKLASEGVERAATRRRSGIGYTGRWHSSWDPKAKRTSDGMVIQ